MSHDLPRTGIADAIGLSTDGMLAGFGGIVVQSIDVANVGDEGGWEVVVTGVFPTYIGMYVDIRAGKPFPVTYGRGYSGVLGQGDVCWSADGETLRFITPPLQVGSLYDIRVQTTDGAQTGSLEDTLPVWKRSYTTNLYNLRAAHPPPRAVGAYDPGLEKWGAENTGDNDTLYSAILTALADTLQETHGFLLTRVYEAVSAGFVTLKCEGLHRWPTAGRIALNGRMYRYTGVSAVFDSTPATPATSHYCRLTGVTEDDGSSATLAGAALGDVLVYMGGDDTDMDRLRLSFFIETAEGADLDTLGRNYGLSRPRGLIDEDYRALLRVLIYLPAQTIYAVEKVLDVLRGPGTYEVYELFPMPDENNRFYVQLQATAGGPTGRAYMTAFELLASVGSTVTVTQPISVLNGVWSSTDPYRAGTNYAEATEAFTELAPDRLQTAAAFWEPGDLGRSVRLSDGSLWVVTAYLDPQTVQVASPTRTDGLLNAGNPDRVVALGTAFRSWMEGHELVIPSGPNAGAWVIDTFVSEREVALVGAAFTTESNVAFYVRPAFAGAAVTGTVMRATIAGMVITCPNVLPANVYVDYATTPSGEALPDGFADGTGQFPFYLFDDTFIVALILDIVKAAGVEAVVLLE